MRMSIAVIAVTAALFIPIHGEAKGIRDPGGGFVGQKQPKLGKNYYVVLRENGCALATGKTGVRPDGALGDAPYASKSYAAAAAKTFPECKGGLAGDENTGKKKKKKEKEE